MAEGLVDRVHIVGDAREHLTLSVFGTVKISQRHVVHLLRDVAAEAIGNVGRDIGHDPALDVGKKCRYEIQAQSDENDASNGIEIDRAGSTNLRHHAFEQLGGCLTENFWPGDVGGCRSDGKDEDDDDRFSICSKICDQFLHRAHKVLGFFASHHGTMPHGAATSGTSLAGSTALHHHASSS